MTAEGIHKRPNTFPNVSLACDNFREEGSPQHPSLKLGVSLNDRVHWNGQCYAKFDSKADRVTGMGTNSD